MSAVVDSDIGPTIIDFLRKELVPILKTAEWRGAGDRAVTPRIIQDIERVEVQIAARLRAMAARRLVGEAFGVNPATLAAPNIAGDYFGYRRSADRGDIIRFHIKIDRAEGMNVVSFTNAFIRRNENWRTEGFGLSIHDTNFLIGQARHGRLGSVLGLRCFTLVRYLKEDWLVGNLLSEHPSGHGPISARIVLIPVAEHKGLPRAKDQTHDEFIQAAISSDKLSLEKLEADLVGAEPSALQGGVRFTDYIQFLIWNWTLTTLTTSRTDLPTDPRELIALREIWRLEAELHTIQTNSSSGVGDKAASEAEGSSAAVPGRYATMLASMIAALKGTSTH